MEDRLVTLRSTTYIKAQFIKNNLENEGINCYLKSVNAIRSTVPGGVQVRIKEEDLARAMRICKRIDEEEKRKSQEEILHDDKLQRIMVPVDFSETSTKACAYAFNIARQFNAEVNLVHVYPSPVLDVIPVTESHTVQVNVDVMIREMESNVKQDMEQYLEKIKRRFSAILNEGINLTYEIFSGEPALDVIDYAESYKPDMIIIGTKSKTAKKKSKNLSKFIAQVIELANTPVLIIPDDTQFDDIHKVENMVYATDFDETDFMAIRKLMRIIQPFHIKIFCIHIGEDADNPWEQVKIEALEDYFKHSYKNVNVKCSIIVGSDIIERLNTFSKEYNIGIVALTTHKRNILTRILNPSTTKLMMHNTDIPLLVFHA